MKVSLRNEMNFEWGDMELVGSLSQAENEKVVSTTIYFLIRANGNWRTLPMLRFSLERLFFDCVVMTVADQCDNCVILFSRKVAGRLRNPKRLLQATARKIDRESENLEDIIDQQDEEDDLEACLEYEESYMDAPPSMDEPGGSLWLADGCRE